MSRQTISFKFKLLRNTIGVSQKDLAEWLGCSQGTLVNYENGKTDLPFEYVRMFMHYGVSVDFFIKEHTPVPTKSIASLRKAIKKKVGTLNPLQSEKS